MATTDTNGDCYGVLGDASICANHPGGKMTSADVCTAKYTNMNTVASREHINVNKATLHPALKVYDGPDYFARTHYRWILLSLAVKTAPTLSYTGKRSLDLWLDEWHDLLFGALPVDCNECKEVGRG